MRWALGLMRWALGLVPLMNQRLTGGMPKNQAF
jgi:hypothetical protein